MYKYCICVTLGNLQNKAIFIKNKKLKFKTHSFIRTFHTKLIPRIFKVQYWKIKLLYKKLYLFLYNSISTKSHDFVREKYIR